MHVWLVNPYGALPGEAWREYRAVLAARALVAAGHTVTWWVANFEHRSKRFRGAEFEVRPLFEGFEAAIVPTTGYQRHISFGRVRFEQRFAAGVRALGRAAARPDVIVLGEPALFTSGPVLELARELSVPLMLDMADLWPELFQIALPRVARPLGRLLFAPLFRRRARLVRASDGYVAVTRDYLELLQSIAPRENSAVVYWGVDVHAVRREMADAVPLPAAIVSRQKAEGDFWVVYAGTLGPNYDIRTILRAAELLRDAAPQVTVIIAGDGASRHEVEQTIAERALTNCVFLGSLPPAVVTRVYGLCDAALSTYVRDSTVSMPIKAFDYFAAGLPIVNSLGRDLGWFVSTHDVGVQYEPENPRALADVVRSLASDRQRRDRMARNAAELGMRFHSPVQYARFVEVAEAVAATGQPARESARA
jgi:glycosyltransferase involved in cell wall biosynthesis